MDAARRRLTSLAAAIAAITLGSCGVPLDAGGPAPPFPTLTPQALDERASTLISLHSQVIDTAQPQEPPPALRARPATADDSEILLVKFPAPVTARQEQALRATTLRVYTYLPYYTYLVKVPAGAARTAAAFAGASWTGLYHPAYKMSREIAGVRGTGHGAATDQRPVMVHLFPDADLSAVAQAIQGLGARSILGAQPAGAFARVRLMLTPAEIATLRTSLAGLREVFWIELEGRRTLRNDTTIWVGQSGLSGGQTTPIFTQGLYGQGQTVGIIDTGIDADSCYFSQSGIGLPPTNLCNGGTVTDPTRRKIIAVDFLAAAECSGGVASTEWDTQGHGTHVAGTVAGDNPVTPLLHDAADGMAPGAKLVIQDAGFATDSCGDLPGIGCPVVDLKPLFQQAHDQGARLHSNSWGDNENATVQNNYTAASQDVDQFMWDHKDHLIFFAAGNSGPGAGSVGSPSTNKNGVSVGATLRGTSANSMASFSSCGKTADGRIKPDITVPGSSIISAGNDRNVASNNCGTATMSGTSMATPGAAGLSALIRQYYTEGWYPSGARVATDSLTPSAALLKATLVNSAVNMTGTTAIPADCQGWGRVLLENSLYFTGQARKLWVKDDAAPFATGSTNEDRAYSFTISSSTEPLKITLAWTDYPSTPAANPNLNNDIDLIVIGPGGTYLGNVFSGGASATGGSADRRNTLEQVLLSSPPVGTYTVTVRSFNIPTGAQPFALVVSGALGAGCTGDAQCSDGLFCNGAETCVMGACLPGTAPCATTSCDEATDTCNSTQVSFTSVASQDGWVLESSEPADTGSSISSTAGTASALRVGDDNQDRQYKAVVSFDTSSIPDGAVILSATLRLRRGTVMGTNPFTTHGACFVDVHSAFAGSTSLQSGDFQAAATVVQAASLSAATINGAWSEGALSSAGRAAINKTGVTQLRVYFALDDNDDSGTDYIGYYSGDNATASNRPQLVVTYQ